MGDNAARAIEPGGRASSVQLTWTVMGVRKRQTLHHLKCLIPVPFLVLASVRPSRITPVSPSDNHELDVIRAFSVAVAARYKHGHLAAQPQEPHCHEF